MISLETYCMELILLHESPALAALWVSHRAGTSAGTSAGLIVALPVDWY